MTKEKLKPQFNISLCGGSFTVMQNNTIEIYDCDNITIEDLELVVEEAKAYIKYRDSRRIFQ